MKKSLLFMAAIAAMFTLSCKTDNADGKTDSNGNDSNATAQTTDGAQTTSNPWPWDFPKDLKVDVQEGQYVLSPYTFYPAAIEEGKDLTERSLIFYYANVKSSANGTVDLKQGKMPMPSSLIIPMDPNAKAKKGDIVLTWWQSGSGMVRAIVTDASDPAQPKVHYLDLGYKDDPTNPGIAQKHDNEKLKPGSFIVLQDGKLEPGAQVACEENDKWFFGKVIKESDDKVLVLAFADRIKVFEKDDVKVIPFKEDIKVGDKVWGRFAANYREDFKVTKVDPNIGRVWAEHNGHAEVYNFYEVTKVLD